MKKIINKPTDVLPEMLDGLAFVHSDLVHRVEGFDIIARNAKKTGKVGVISGGGSGHEPSHAGFVGDGMLSAAICGAVFTSPTPDQVLEAIKEADEGAGVFMVIKNYSGDVMNFEMAQDLAEWKASMWLALSLTMTLLLKIVFTLKAVAVLLELSLFIRFLGTWLALANPLTRSKHALMN